MKTLHIHLENCYGIKFLDEKLDFSQNHVAIYASNGTMKSSLAKTFTDIHNNIEPSDRIFERKTVWKVLDENKKEISKKEILVINSYQNKSDTTIDDQDIEKTSKQILVNKELRDEFTSLTNALYHKKDNIIEELGNSIGISQNVEDRIIHDFNHNSNENDIIFSLLINECNTNVDNTFLDITYDIIFDPKVESVLRNDTNLTQLLNMYIENYIKLLDNSVYFQKGFDLRNAGQIDKYLDTNGFFNVHHEIMFKT